MLICNVEANYQFATLQSCFIIRSRLNFFCVLVPASDVWLLYNRGCFASVFFITSCAGDIELSDLPHTGAHLTLAHVRMVQWLPSALTAFSLDAIFVSQKKRKRKTEMTKKGENIEGKALNWTSVDALSCSTKTKLRKERHALHFKQVFLPCRKDRGRTLRQELYKNKSKQ